MQGGKLAILDHIFGPKLFQFLALKQEINIKSSCVGKYTDWMEKAAVEPWKH